LAVYTSLRDDYIKAFEFRDIDDGRQVLMGTMLHREQLFKIEETFRDTSQIDLRVKKIQNNLVRKAFHLNNGDTSKLFPVPLRYSTALVVKFRARIGRVGESMFCMAETNVDALLSFSAAYRTHGYSFLPKKMDSTDQQRARQIANEPVVVSTEPCLSGEFLLNTGKVQLTVNLEACQKTHVQGNAVCDALADDEVIAAIQGVDETTRPNSNPSPNPNPHSRCRREDG